MTNLNPDRPAKPKLDMNITNGLFSLTQGIHSAMVVDVSIRLPPTSPSLHPSDNMTTTPFTETLPTKALLDTGAEGRSYMSDEFAKANWDVLGPLTRPSTLHVRLGDSKTTLPIIYELPLTIQLTDVDGKVHFATETFHVFNMKTPLILGLPLLLSQLGSFFKNHVSRLVDKRRKDNLPDSHAGIWPSLMALLDFDSDGEIKPRDGLLQEPWTSDPQDPTPEEQEEGDIGMFHSHLSFMEMPVEESQSEYMNTYRDHIDPELLKSKTIERLMTTKGLQSYVPTSWTGIRMPPVDIDFLPNGPNSIDPKWRKIPLKRRPAAVKEISRLLKYFLVPSNSPWASAMVFASKDTDPFIRICGDYPTVNKQIPRAHYPIPNIKDEIQRLIKFKYFLELDLTNSFHQVPLSKATSEKLSVVCELGQFRPLFLPEGVSNASCVLQRMVIEHFSAVPDSTTIFDNILVGADTLEDLEKKLEQIFDICIEYNIFLKLKKSQMGRPTASFFGYKLSQGKYELTAERALAINAIPFPLGQLQMQRFLGSSLFFRDFIPDFAAFTAPLHQMTQKNFNWSESTWTHDYRSVFEEVKKQLLHSMALHHADPTLKWTLRSDASQTGWGCALLQETLEGKLQVISLISGKFSAQALNWTILEKEGYALYRAVHDHSYFLRGTHFTLETDCANLIFMESSIVPKIIRWRIFLQSFALTLKHIPGTTNKLPDWLSRLLRLSNAEYFESNYAMNGMDTTSSGLYELATSSMLSLIDAFDVPISDEEVSAAKLHIETSPLSALFCSLPSDAPILAPIAPLNPELPVIPLLHVPVPVIAVPPLIAIPPVFPAPAPIVAPVPPQGPRAREMFDQVHGGTSFHQGLARTVAKLDKQFPGHGIPVTVVADWILTCAHCQKYRLGRGPRLVPVVKSFHAEHSHSTVSADGLEIGIDNFGNRHLMVFVNSLTKHVHFFPTKDKEAETLALCCLQYCALFGYFDEFKSDPGSDFTSRVIAQLNVYLGQRHVVTHTAHPEANGVERSNQKLLYYLRSLTSDLRFRDRWSHPQVLSLIQHAVNNDSNSETGTTPFANTFGSLAKIYAKIPRLGDINRRSHRFLQLLDEDLTTVVSVTKSFQQKHAAHRQRNNPVAPNLYQPGDLILIEMELRPHKLGYKWAGPRRVITHIGNDVTVLDLVNGGTACLHSDTLKRFYGSDSEALAAARSDTEQFDVSHFSNYTGFPATRSNMTFRTHFSDGDIIWKPYDRDISETVQFADFCSQYRQLEFLTQTSADAKKSMARIKALPISTVNPGDVFFTDIRSFGNEAWYEALALPDSASKMYVIKIEYREFAHTARQARKQIWTYYPVLDEAHLADNLFVHQYGSQHSVLAPNMLLVDEALVLQFPRIKTG